MQSNLKDINFDLLEKPLVEYIKRRRKIGKQKVGNKQKVGVLVAGFEPDRLNRVIIGFTLCSKLDKWDWIQGKENRPGFGKDLATKRAIKWDSNGGIQDKQPLNVPESISKEFSAFISRCEAYYKGKKLSDWVVRFW